MTKTESKSNSRLFRFFDQFGVEHIKSLGAFVITFFAGIIVLGGVVKDTKKEMKDIDIELR